MHQISFSLTKLINNGDGSRLVYDVLSTHKLTTLSKEHIGFFGKISYIYCITMTT